MIGIRTNKGWLELPSNIKIKMVENSPLFSTSLINGDYSYPFTVDATPHNRRMLGFPEVINNLADLNADINADLWVGGTLKFKGLLSLLPSDNDKYKFNFYKDVGYLAKKLKQKKLNEFNLGNFSIIEPYLTFRISSSTIDFVTLHIIRQTSLEEYYYEQEFVTSKQHTLDLLVTKINNDSGFPYFDPVDGVYTGTVGATIGSIVAYSGKLYECLLDTGPGATTPVNNGIDWIEYSFGDYTGKYDNANANIYAFRENDDIFIYDRDYLTANLFDYVLSVGRFMTLQGQSITSYVQNEYSGLFLDKLKQNAYLSYPDTNYAVFPIKNESFTDLESWKKHQNNYDAYDGSTTDRFINNGSSGIFANAITPSVFLFSILDKIRDELALKYISSGFLTDTELQKLVLYSNFGADSPGRYSSDTVVQNGYDWNGLISKHLPDATIEELLLSIKNTFFVGIFLDSTNNTIRFEFLKDILAGKKKVDWTKYLSPEYNYTLPDKKGYLLKFTPQSGDSLNSYIKNLKGYTRIADVETFADLPTTDIAEKYVCFVKSENSYYTVVRVVNSVTFVLTYEWQFFSFNLIDYVYGEGSKTYTTPCISLPMYKGDDLNDDNSPKRKWLIPQTEFKGSSEIFSHGINPCKIRYLFYRGWKENSEGSKYPFASSDIYDYDGNTVGEYSLKWDGENGLFEKFGKLWIQFLDKKRDVECTGNVPLIELNKFTFDTLVSKDGNNYLVSQITYSISNEGISEQKFYLSKT